MAIYSITNIVATDERDFTQQFVNALDANTAWQLVRTEMDYPDQGRDTYVLQNTVHGFYIRVCSSVYRLSSNQNVLYSPSVAPLLTHDQNTVLYPNPPTLYEVDTSYSSTVGGETIFYSYQVSPAHFPAKVMLLTNTQTPDFYSFIEFADGHNTTFNYMLFKQRDELKVGASRTHETMGFWSGISSDVAGPMSNKGLLVSLVRIYSDGKYAGQFDASDAPSLIEEGQKTKVGNYNYLGGFYSPAMVFSPTSGRCLPDFALSGIGAIGCIYFNQYGFLPNTNPNSSRSVSDSVCVPDIYWHWQLRLSPYEDIQYGNATYRHIGNFPGETFSSGYAYNQNSLKQGGGLLVRVG